MSSRMAAEKIVRQLRQRGYEALLAGGCVRDMLLRRRANDYDVATSARPDDVMRLFRRTLKVGAKFGVVIVLTGNEQVEVATFRTEGGYADGRHPGRVEFTTVEEDAKRRDFTINGMFYDPVERQVIDYVGGREDLNRQVIRTIGSAAERFGEDYLRMLRAVRFSTKLGFEIESETYKAICRTAEKINLISGERIALELEGIVTNANRAKGVKMLADCGLAWQIFEGFNKEKILSAVKVLDELPNKISFPLGLAAMFADWPVEACLQRCERLKLSRGQEKHIRFLLHNRGVLVDAEISLAKLRRLAAEPYFGDLYLFQRAIQKAARESTAALCKIKRRVRELGDIELTPRPLLDGYELMRLGAKEGPSLGQLAEEMYVEQLNGHIKTVEQARGWVLEKLGNKSRRAGNC